MSGEVCLIMTPKLEELYNKLQSKYPKECEASLVNKNVFLGWVELCQKDKKENPNYIPSLNEVVHTAEKYKNMDGKSFLHLNTNTAVQEEINSNNEDVTRFAIDASKVDNSLEAFKKNVEKLKDISKDFSKKDSMPIELQKLPDSIFTMLKEHFTQHKELTENDYKELSKHIGFRPDGSIYNKQIVQELVDHLKAKGAKVIGREAMKEYLEKHPNVLQAIEGNREMQDIKAKAIANGTFMKAPNGKPTNLTEKQWLQVRTKAFKKWFGDWENDPKNASKVVDENGEPLVVYHGSRSKDKISVFNSYYEKGTFFSTSKNVGSIYATNENNLYSVFINSKNPLIIDNNGKDWNKINAEDLVVAAEKMFGISKEEYLESLGEDKILTTDGIIAAISRLSEEGNSPYDGFILKNVVETEGNEVATDIVTFKSNQIKSATDNNGEFSTENDDIQMFTTPEGEIYGFVDKDNNIYLDESIIDYSHPIHEYTHIWDRIVAKNYPDFWKQGVKLFKELDLWKEIENDENYGKAWKQIKGMTQDRLDNLIASEVHARVAGKMAEKEISDLANSKSSHKNIIEELKKWYEKFWEYVSRLVLGNDKVNSRSKISSIAKMTLGDFLSDANINQVNSNNIESFMHEFGTTSSQESEPIKISYTYRGTEKQIYTIKGSHIYNKDGKEVFAKDSKDRRKIFANLAVQQKRAVVVDYKGKQYVVNNRQQIISVTTGNEMQWREENGDRKEIIRLAETKFKELTKNSTSNSILNEVKETHTALEKDLGGDDNAKKEIKDTVKVAKKGLAFEEAVKGQESFFTKEEQDEIKKGLNGKNLQVMSVSRQTDPAFFSKEIVKFLEVNANKPLSDPTRVNAIEIWSKHDGLPIKDILDATKYGLTSFGS